MRVSNWWRAVVEEKATERSIVEWTRVALYLEIITFAVGFGGGLVLLGLFGDDFGVFSAQGGTVLDILANGLNKGLEVVTYFLFASVFVVLTKAFISYKNCA